jgi:hypothetical protein
MGAQVKNPRKKFNFSISFPKHPLNPYLCQKVQLPDLEIEQVSHGDINRDVKTAGRVSVGNMTIEKLSVTSGSDTWILDWLYACQDHINGGGLTPSQYWEEMVINELAEDGVSIINSWVLTEVWPCKISGIELDRTSSDNTIESIEFSVGTIDKY